MLGFLADRQKERLIVVIAEAVGKSFASIENPAASSAKRPPDARAFAALSGRSFGRGKYGVWVRAVRYLRQMRLFSACSLAGLPWAGWGATVGWAVLSDNARLMYLHWHETSHWSAQGLSRIFCPQSWLERRVADLDGTVSIGMSGRAGL